MTTYRGLLPTLLGVASILPATSAPALPNPTSAVSELVLPTSAKQVTLDSPEFRDPGSQSNQSLSMPYVQATPVATPTTDGKLPGGYLKHALPDTLQAGKANRIRQEFHLTAATLQPLPHSFGVAQRQSVSTDTKPQRFAQQAVAVEETPTRDEPSTHSGSPSTLDDTLVGQSPAGNRIRILTPQSGVVRERSTSLVIQYPAGTAVQVKINGDALDSDLPTQIDRNEAENLVTQTWYNIPLKDGDNVLTVQAGNEPPIELRLEVTSTAAKLELTPTGDPRVRADGRSMVTITGRITDANGELIAHDAIVTLTASAGQFIGADQDEDQPGFQVLAKEGQFSAQLQSALNAQQVRIRGAVDYSRKPSLTLEQEEFFNPGRDLTLNTELEAYTQVEFVPNLRPSIVSGFVNLRVGPGGTDYWGSMRDFLNPDEIDRGYGADLNAALFATGPIGEWLFTGAFNSDRPLNQTCDGTNRIFGGIQFCEKQYPVYGDSSTVDYLTPSKDSFYVRLERPSRVTGAETDYIMWGDYYTREFARGSQLFSANDRTLHGFKANYSFGNLQATVLFSPDVDGFQRDTIVPNGTSGYYFLSRRLVVPGTENIYLETEEINRPGTVVERKQLNRGSDYEIDYDRGSLLFRRPILATEFDPFANTISSPLLVRRIVATYQFEGGGEDTNIYAGRLQYNFSQRFDRRSWAGASYWREDQGMRDFSLFGLDFLVSLGTRGQIVGEYALSRNEFIYRGTESGSAYRLEASGAITNWLFGRAFYRSVDENFLNNATLSFTPGQTRYGANLSAQVTKTTLLEFQYDHEDNFGISSAVLTDLPDLFNPGFEARPGSRVDNSLTTISAGVRQRIGRADLSVNYVMRSREDDAGDFDGDANQLVSRLNVPLLFKDDETSRSRSPYLTFRAQNELNLGDSDPLYPNRTTLGLDWAAYPGVVLRLAHQFFDGGLLDNNSITSLDTIVERELWKNTTMTSRYSVISGYDGITGQGAMGVQSRWTVLPGLRLNLSYERIFEDVFTRTSAGRRFRQPYAVGQSAASLGLGAGNSFGIGLEYTDNPDFQASTRFEYRIGDDDTDNMVISAAAAGKVSRAITALFRYQQANFANQRIQGLDDTINLRLGLAYRDPNEDRFNALLKYEFRRNPTTTPEDLLRDNGTGATDHLFAVEAIYAPNWRWEFYGKGAFRISNVDLARNFSNNSGIYLAQARATYKLGYRTDVAAEARWIGQPDADYNEFGWALEAGYYITPDLRLGVGYSFGGVDDRDFTGYRSEGGPYFQLTFKVNELFGGFGRQRVVPRQQPESQTVPVAQKNQQPSAEQLQVSSVNTQLKNQDSTLNLPSETLSLKFINIHQSPTNTDARDR